MTDFEKITLYNHQKVNIDRTLKSQSITKSLWRKLFWSTAKNSDIYKVGCIDIYKDHFPEEFVKVTN